MTPFSDLQSMAEQAARAAGSLLSGALQLDPGVLSSKGHDIKTQADRDAEAEVLRILAPTGMAIVAEESGLHTPDSARTVQQQVESSDPCWIVDPLDGTYNYTRGMPWTCVSIALWDNGAPSLGVIYDFNTDEMWTGVPGLGAFCNGEPIQVSQVTAKNQAVLCTGFPSARDMSNEALRTMFEEIQAYKKIRMIGSAALAMIFVARGWADLYKEESSWIWDIAAGMAIVQAAGGTATITNLQPNGQLNITAGNGSFVPFGP